ncbi:MAG: EutN/CcmL family microcompartment protein [bacterium]|nr:EutN/CcmL family microcompartment protein [bacterium]
MIVARVLGTVVCTQKNPKLEGFKLQLVQAVDYKEFKGEGKPLVAVDSVGAGQGEIVLVVSGSSARQTEATQNTPVDAVIMAIVDTIDMDGKIIFRKEDAQ